LGSIFSLNHDNPLKGDTMIWFLLLLLLAVAGIFIDSFRLFLLGLLVLAIYAYPLVTLPSLGAVIWWAIRINLKR
jgi:hypothetical protein